MRLWTVQPIEILERLHGEGALSAKELSVDSAPAAYGWLRNQLATRFPNFEGNALWWFYVERPDLRWVRHTVPRGDRWVRLEFEIEDDRIFVMPSWAWHLVYCGQFLAVTEVEYREWRQDAGWLDEVEWEDYPEFEWHRIVSSWERLFDSNLPRIAWPSFETDYSGGSRGSEAVSELLRADELVRSTEFRGTSRWWAMVHGLASKR